MLIVILWALLSGRSKHAPVIKEPLRSLSECLDTEIEKGRVKLDLLTKPKTSTSDKLSIACDPTVEGCIKLNRWEAGPVNFLRISIKTDSVEPVTNCKAFLTRIEKNEEKKWGDHSPQLTFSEGEDPDALAKTVYNKVPAFIDVLALTSWGEIRPGTKNRIWPFMPRMHEIFSEVGDYVLTVVITGDGAEPITALLKFNWTRNWQTSWLTLIPESSIQSPAPPQSWAISYEQETEMLGILKDSPKAAVMIMSTKQDRAGNRYAMRLVQVLRKTGMEIGQCVFDESWRLPTGVNLWASDFADNRQISKLRAAIKATNMECGDAPREPPTVSSPTRFEIDIMVKSSGT
jgi:hypothetical protein